MIKESAKQFLDKMIDEYEKCENQEKIQEKVLNPIIYYIISVLYPYLLTLFIMFVIIFLISLYVIYNLYKFTS